MSTFQEIQDRIQKEIASKDILEPVADKGQVVTNPDGTPVLQKVGVLGKVVSMPGTEVVAIDASSFQLMQCVANTPGREKPRYCIVEKGARAKYGNHFVTAGQERAHVITREVYFLLLSVLNGANQRIITLTTERDAATERAELHKLTIDALRKNGVID